jgi:hypothetical protein
MVENDTPGASDSLPDRPVAPTINASSDSLTFHDFGDSAQSRVSKPQDLHPLQEALTSNSTVENWTPAQVADDPFFQLTWPDSEDLLQSLLSTDFSTWQPPLETLPSHSIAANGHHASEEQVRSPWLAIDGAGNTAHSGNNAVRDLSRIITSVVGHLLARASFRGKENW